MERSVIHKVIKTLTKNRNGERKVFVRMFFQKFRNKLSVQSVIAWEEITSITLITDRDIAINGNERDIVLVANENVREVMIQVCYGVSMPFDITFHTLGTIS